MGYQDKLKPLAAPSYLGKLKPLAAPAAPAPEASPPTPLDRVTGAVNAIFPGKQVGQALSNSVDFLGSLFKGDMPGAENAAAQNDKLAPRVFADAAASVATPASMLLTGPAGSGFKTAAARVATNAGLGAGLGGLSAASQGGSAKDVLKSAGIGAALSGGLSAAGEGMSAALNKLPTRLVNKALPKLKDGNVEYALKNTKLAPISTLLKDSDTAVEDYGTQVTSILEHSKYAASLGNGSQPIDDAISRFSDALLDPGQVIDHLKQVAPAQKATIDKLSRGEATLIEKNRLRIALDQATKKVFTDNPTVSFSKQIANAVSNSLRNDVQTNAPETAPIFAEFTKEMDLNQALTKMTKTLRGKSAFGLYDIIAGLGGLTTLGPVGGIGAIIGEKAVRSPAVSLAAAKGVQKVANLGPTVGALSEAAQPEAIKALTNQEPTRSGQSLPPAILPPSVQSSAKPSTDYGHANPDGTITVKGPFSGKDIILDPSMGALSVERVGAKLTGKAAVTAADMLKDFLVEHLPKSSGKLNLAIEEEAANFIDFLKTARKPTLADMQKGLEIMRLQGKSVEPITKAILDTSDNAIKYLRDAVGRFRTK